MYTYIICIYTYTHTHLLVRPGLELELAVEAGDLGALQHVPNLLF